MAEEVMAKITRTFPIKVTTKVQQLCAKDPNRRCIFVYNNSSNVVYILGAQNQAYTDGIPVAASGGTYKNDVTSAELYIVAATGTNDVRVQVDGM